MTEPIFTASARPELLELAEKYDRRGPRYTSYPTAPHFRDAFGPQSYERALSTTDADAEQWAARQLGEEPGFSFQPKGTWIMEQLDQALLAHGALGEANFPFEEDVQVERLPVGQIRRIMASEQSFGPDAPPVNPLYAGLLWKGTETSLNMLKHLTRQ